MAATTEEVPRDYGRGTFSVISFIVAMNRVDVVELVVDLVDVDLDVGLVDVDLDVDFVDVDLVDVDLDVDVVDVELVDVDLVDGNLVDVDLEVDLPSDRITRQECFRLLSFEKCLKTN